MGFWNTLSTGIVNIGKGAADAVITVGKAAGNATQTLGKGVLAVASGVSKGLDSALNTVETVAGKVAELPIIGELAKLAMNTPIGVQIQSAFNTAKEINDALKEAVSIGNKINEFVDRLSTLSPADLQNPSKRLEISNAIISIQRDLGTSTIGRKIGAVPAFKKQVDKFVMVSNKVQSKLGTETVAKIKKELNNLAVLPPTMPQAKNVQRA